MKKTKKKTKGSGFGKTDSGEMGMRFFRQRICGPPPTVFRAMQPPIIFVFVLASHLSMILHKFVNTCDQYILVYGEKKIYILVQVFYFYLNIVNK